MSIEQPIVSRLKAELRADSDRWTQLTKLYANVATKDVDMLIEDVGDMLSGLNEIQGFQINLATKHSPPTFFFAGNTELTFTLSSGNNLRQSITNLLDLLIND